MRIIKRIDLGSRLEEFGKQIRMPPNDYPLKFPVYDIAGEDDKTLLLALYQNNCIASLDLDAESLLVYPLEIDHPHGIFLHDNIVVVSCYRRGCIQLHKVQSLDLISRIDIPNFYPISSVLYMDLILSIDYFNSKLLAISMKDYSVSRDLSHLLNHARKPHSIKFFEGFIYISCQDPQVVIILEGLNFVAQIPVECDGQLMSAIPTINSQLLLAVHGAGIKKVSVETNVVSNVFDLSDVTSIQSSQQRLSIASESGIVRQLEVW